MSNLKQDLFGRILLEPEGEFIAGSFNSFTLTYIAGTYGMDDLGGLKILFRFACDQSPLQMEDPTAVGYTTAQASNGAEVILSYALREGERPWYKVLRVRIAGKGLTKGEKIRIFIGNTSLGPPGLRLQTFCEPNFKFYTLVDVFSTNVFIPLTSPRISIISGPAIHWKASIPTLIKNGEKFSLKFRVEDKWGNPSNKASCDLILKSSHLINGLPEKFKVEKGQFSHVIEDLKVENLDENNSINPIFIRLYDSSLNLLVKTNPMIVRSESSFKHFWGDIHGQSEETIGTNPAEGYFIFARDLAFLDVMGHQGNDFQITAELWNLFNELSEKFYDPNAFVPLFGYEFSANTALGGDHNVYFLKSHQSIHRSSHALILDKKDINTDCLNASDLFSALLMDNSDAENSVVVIPHVGGRYADILNHFEGKIEHSIEIHSSWGTFEWLLYDAFEKGYRVGIVANSDDHKGRPGVAYPGASKFGTYGGLTCFLSPNLTRPEIFEALKNRKHYATTGERIYLDIKGILTNKCKKYSRDPAFFNKEKIDIVLTKEVLIGDIVEVPDLIDLDLSLIVNISSASPLDRVELFNGKDVISTIRPYLFTKEQIGDNAFYSIHLNEKQKEKDNENLIIKKLQRIRIRWEGAEYRARKRNTKWKGFIEFPKNKIISATSFNFWNQDAPLRQTSINKLEWNTMTSGNFQGIEVDLLNPFEGILIFKSNQISFKIPIKEIGIQDKVFNIGGGIGKQVRLHRYIHNNSHFSFNFKIKLPLKPIPKKDERIFIKITLENGHQAWSSPIYFIKN